MAAVPARAAGHADGQSSGQSTSTEPPWERRALSQALHGMTGYLDGIALQWISLDSSCPAGCKWAQLPRLEKVGLLLQDAVQAEGPDAQHRAKVHASLDGLDDVGRRVDRLQQVARRQEGG